MSSEPQPIRVVVVDDSAFMRRAIRTMIDAAEDMTVVATAHNGVEAIEQINKFKPDAVTLDIEMPQMDGLTALRHIKRHSDTAVLMVSSLTVAGSAAALSALRMGADDFIAKDNSQISLSVVNIQSDLQAKLRAIARKPRGHLAKMQAAASPVHPHSVELTAKDVDAVVIGASTGGPPVLEKLIESLPAELAVPIVIAQHMPRLFTAAMSERMNGMCEVTVAHGENGLPLEPGRVYVAPGELHTRLRPATGRRYRMEVSPYPHEALYRPSVNELFASAAKCCGKRCLAIVLTGMGDDGLIGGRTLHEAGATIVAQDCHTCVVYGMPKAVTEAGLIQASMTPTQIGQLIGRLTACPASAA